MIGFGTLLNGACIVLGGILGTFFGKKVSERYRESLMNACGVSVLFIGIGGAMEKMLSVTENGLASGSTMLLVLSLALGALLGEFINIEHYIEKFGMWLKRKTGSESDAGLVDGFVSASFTVCIGAMAIVGAVNDGISGDYTILAAKSLLDAIVILIMTASMGKGCIFSAIPVVLLQGTVTLHARLSSVLLTDGAIFNLSLVGSVLVFCVGLNLVWGKKIRVANFLPAMILAVVAAYI